MRADVERVARSLGASASGVYGEIAFACDVSHISGSDLVRIIPIVALLIALLLAIVPRAPVRPIASDTHESVVNFSVRTS
jgi:predicted RND superfamily exporter protein